jgi:hypothetical protein
MTTFASNLQLFSDAPLALALLDCASTRSTISRAPTAMMYSGRSAPVIGGENSTAGIGGNGF